MNPEQVEDMLSEIVEELDYDIWKEIFIPIEDEEEEQDRLEELGRLAKIVRKYL